jgi:alkylhydroperoxidase family enzyme
MKADDAQMANDAIDDPYSGKVKRLKEAILSGLGALDPKVRMAASLATGLHDALGPYVEKVARHAYQVTDEDISALRQAGYSEDQLFEATVSAALGAGLVRLEAGLGALQRGGNLSVSHT